MGSSNEFEARMRRDKARKHSRIVLRESQGNEAEAGNRPLRGMGMQQRPNGTVYMGSIALHFYGNSDDTDPKPIYGIQTTRLDKIPEQIVMEGCQHLKDKLMQIWGRGEPWKKG